MKRLVRLRDIYGCAQQGLLYMAQQDYQSALSYLSQGCSAGFTQHCSAIGDIYNQGVGISKDTNKAISYYQKGCSQIMPMHVISWQN